MSLLETFFKSGIDSVLVGALTMAAGLIAALLSARNAKMMAMEEQKLRQVEQALSASYQLRKSAVAESVAESVAPNLTTDDVKASIKEALLSNASLLSSSQPQSLSFVADLVSSYHTQALSQAKVQFWFSVVAASVGFLYILGAAIYASATNTTSLVNIIPGVVIDAVAFLFFRQAEQIRERATALYDRLRQDRQTDSARELVESIDDANLRALVKAQIALHMSGISPKEIDLQSIGRTS